jgi:uncharacterized protein (TIGR03437 family)
LVTVSLSAPTNPSTFTVGTSFTVTANPSATGATISRVDFFDGSVALGSATTAPYSITSGSSMVAGNHYLTATARDSRGITATSAPVTVKISKALKSVRNNRKSATDLLSSAIMSGDAVMSAAALDTFADDLEQTYNDFTAERNMFSTAPQIDRYLYAALYVARSAAALAKVPSPNVGVNDRLNKVDGYLSFCEDLMVQDSIAVATLTRAAQLKARVDISIDQPVASTAAGTGFILSPRDVGRLLTTASAPFSTQTAFAGNGGATYELANVTVSVNGQAAALQMVSPMQVNFTVPNSTPGGLADIVVTSREGFILHSTAAVAGLNPTILGWSGDSSGTGAALDAVSYQSGPFSAFAAGSFSFDLRTRLSIWTSGISTGISNTNPANDILLGPGQTLENLAESVSVEARTSDGRVFMLPVEYAGAQGTLAGLDQVNVVLVPELNGAGTVQLTVIVGSVRSNTMKVTLQ